MINWIVTSSLLIVIVIFLRAVLKGRISLRLQYGLWLLVLVRLLIPLSLPSQLSIANLMPDAIAQTASQPITYVAYDPQSLPDLARPEPDIQLPYEQQQLQYQQALQDYEQTIMDAKAQTGVPVTWRSILCTIWICGMVIVGITLFTSNLHFAKQLKHSAKEFSVPDCHVPVYVSDRIATPCLFGQFRPAIYLTAEIADTAELKRYVVNHELAHHRHRDHIWSFLRCICLVLHWYNPLVWIAATISRQDAELCCDEAAIHLLGEEHRTHYGQALIHMSCAKKDPKSLLITATTMAGSKKALKERIQLIAKHPKTALVTLIIVILVSVVAVGCTFTGQHTEATEPSMQTPAESTEPFPSDEAILPEPVDYPEDQIPTAMVRLDGILYVRDVTYSPTGALPDGYENVGIVRHTYNYDFPMDERNAAQLEIGTQLYKNPEDSTYVFYWRHPQEQHQPQRMINYDLCQYPIDFKGTPEPESDYSIPASYTKWRLQPCCVMVNGMMYAPEEEPVQLSQLPADTILCGSITVSETYPLKNLEGYKVPTGCEVYIDSDLSYAQVYCKMPTTKSFTVVKMVPYVLFSTSALEIFDPPAITKLPSEYTLSTLVGTYTERSGEWTDPSGETHNYSYRVPEIYPFSADAISVQAYLHYIMGTVIEQGIDAAAHGFCPSVHAVDYRCSLNGDILCVVVTESTATDAINYYVFNFDLKTGKLLSSAELLEKLDISRQEYLSAAAPKAQQVHRDWHSYVTDPESDEFYQQQLAATLTEENLSSAQLYLDTDGALIMVLPVVPTAGAAYYQVPVPLY